jgi:hypothetical protein
LVTGVDTSKEIASGSISCSNAGTLQEQWEKEARLAKEDPEWINVFRAGGWATKGPQTNPVGS